MADENGFTIARRLEDAVGSPVILISAHSEDEFADLIATSPAIGFIPKAVLSATEIEQLCGEIHRP
jgi:hypothetical protein